MTHRHRPSSPFNQGTCGDLVGLQASRGERERQRLVSVVGGVTPCDRIIRSPADHSYAAYRRLPRIQRSIYLACPCCVPTLVICQPFNSRESSTSGARGWSSLVSYWAVLVYVVVAALYHPICLKQLYDQQLYVVGGHAHQLSGAGFQGLVTPLPRG